MLNMMADQNAEPTIKIPELPLKLQQTKHIASETDPFSFYEVVGSKFIDCLSRNLIGALTCTGNIQDSRNSISMNIPYYWCNFCNYSTIQKAEILEHIQCHRFTCKFCDFSTYSRCDVIKHILSSHKGKSDLELLWICVLAIDSEPSKAKDKDSLKSVDKRKGDSDGKEIMLLKKIKLEKPDGELMETSIEVPNPTPFSLQNHTNTTEQEFVSHSTNVMQHLITNPSKRCVPETDTGAESFKNTVTNSSEELVPNVMKRMEYFKNTLTKIAKEMKEKNTNDQTDTPSNANCRQTRSKSRSKPPSNVSKSYLRTILTNKDTSPEKDILQDEDKRQEMNLQLSLPEVKIEVDDSYMGTSLENKCLNVSHKDIENIYNHKQPYILSTTQEDPSRSNTSTPDPTNLPLLRTMLTCSETLSSSTASSISGEAVERSLSAESDEARSDQDDDDDYYPNNTSSDEDWGKTKGKPKQKAKAKGGFSCPNCSFSKSPLWKTKNHLALDHPHGNLVLRDCNKNVFVYICPAMRCNFHNTKFETFIKHLDSCGVFSSPIDSKNREMLTSILVTFKNILERSIVSWSYACCFCAMKFANLESAKRHSAEKHKNGCFRDCFFKMKDKPKTIVIICCVCQSEIDVLSWCNVALNDCKDHVRSAINMLRNRLSASNLPEKDPPKKTDATPQLRAILQQDPMRSASPGTENMPASRMLQWLMSEGSRMMHMLK